VRSSATTSVATINSDFPTANRRAKSSRRRKTEKGGAKPSLSDAAAPIRPLVVSVETAIELLDDNRDGIYEKLRQKKLLSFLDGRRRKIFMDSIDELIRERREAALAEPFQQHRYPVKDGAQ
jgi:hypothetical protein